jgi:hypothetical protein
LPKFCPGSVASLAKFNAVYNPPKPPPSIATLQLLRNSVDVVDAACIDNMSGIDRNVRRPDFAGSM